MKKLFLFIITLFFIHISNAQKIKKVSIKDVVMMMDTATNPLIINFWATWCQPCIHEIPWFENAIEEIKDKNVQLVLVSLDFKTDYPKELEDFVTKKGYKAKVVWLNETNADLFCPPIDKEWNGNIPVTVMINNKKKYKVFYGEQIPEPQFKIALKALID